MIAYFNNTFLPVEKTVIHVSDLAVQRGYGVFEFFKIRRGQPLFLDDYFDRFYRSANVMQLEVPLDRCSLKKVIHELLQANNAIDCGIKLVLTGGYSSDGYSISKPNFIITQYPLTLSDSLPTGIKVITHEHVRELPQVKSINYLTGILTQKKMKEEEAADVLYYKNNVVSEFPRCNFFIITKGNVIRTPEKNVLHGITRKNVMRLASENYSIKESAITLDDVRTAKEAFLTSTTKRIFPIVQVDATVIGDGKPGIITERLFKLLIKLEEQELLQGINQ